MKNLVFLAAAGLALSLSGSAAAQLATRSDAPIRADSDHLASDNNNCVATYTGNVEALQDTARLRTDELKVFAEVKKAKPAGSEGGGASCGSTTRIEAHGAVFYVNPQERVHGDDAVWEASNDTLTVTGQQVVAVQDKNVITGTRMVINNQTGEGHMEGSTTGRNKPGRVSTVIYPKDTKGQNGQQAPANAGSGPRK